MTQTTQSGLNYQKQKTFDNHYFEGAKQKALGKYEKAAEEFESSLKIDPNNAASSYQLATVYFKLENLTLALKYASDAVNYSKKYNQYYYGQLGQLYNKAGMYAKSAEVFEQMIKADPKVENNYLEACNQHLNANDLSKALASIIAMENELGVSEESALRKEFIYLKQGKDKEAIQAIIKLTQAYPDNLHFKIILSNSYVETGNIEAAKTELLKVVEADSSYGQAHLMLSEIYRSLGDERMSYHHQVVAFRLPELELNRKLQTITHYFMQMNRNPAYEIRVRNLSDILIEMHPESDMPWILRGDFYNRMDSFELARKYFAEAIEKNASDYRTWNKLLSLDAKLRMPEQQLIDSKKALELFPNIPSIYLSLAYANYDLEKYNDALFAAEDGLDIALEAPDKIELMACIASCFDKLGKSSESDRMFDRILKLSPDNSLIMNNYAYALSIRGNRLEFADSLILEAMKLEANNPYYMDTRAWILFKQGNYDAAISLIENAIKLDPNGPEYFEHLGEIYLKKGDLVKAKENFIKARSLGGTSVELENKIKSLN